MARRSKTVNQSRRLLSLAAVRDGMDRGSAAKIGGMDRQTLRDWVHRFNGSGLEGLVDNWTEGPKPRLSAEQLAQFAQIVEAGPDREKDGVVRWRRLDLKRVIAERFGVDFHPRYIGKLLKKLGFSHISARPRHPAQAYATTISSRSVFPESMRPPKPNSVEPPWYGPVCPVVWEGWRREASPYPDHDFLTIAMRPAMTASPWTERHPFNRTR